MTVEQKKVNVSISCDIVDPRYVFTPLNAEALLSLTTLMARETRMILSKVQTSEKLYRREEKVRAENHEYL